ncbi:MAG: alkaline phosphatase family protein [Candidatus Latescibacteria bacterium]|nr:alkaline phosphatase family protein [Candidatus Latescibacterota bacterium]
MKILGPVAFLLAIALLASSDTPLPAQPHERFIIVGFDGMDPAVTERLIATGKLPHLSWMKEHGAMRVLKTTNPAQSPVAWSAFSTGSNPGKTRIYDFLRRNPATYYPDFSTVTVRRGKFAFGFIPTAAPTVTNNRRGTTFWQIASGRGVRTAVLEAPINFPPEKLQNGVLLSGLGVPDIRGTMGTFSYFATDATGAGDTEMGGKVARLTVDSSGRARSVVHGPRNPFARRDAEGRIPDLTIPVEFRRLKGGGLRIALQGQVRTVRQGHWSDWYSIRFTVAPMVTVRGIARFHVIETSPEMRVYLSPINLDPRRPPIAISSPPAYSAQLARKLGLYKTLGWPEDTWALNEEKIDEEVFLQDLNYSFDRQRSLVLDALGAMDPDLFVTVFQSTDKVQHMFWRLIDPQHPMYSRRLAARYADAIDRVYMRADSLVGLLLERCKDGRTTLLVCSDHGFSSFRKAVNINTWLVRNGYMTLTGTDPARDRNLEDLFGRGTFWPNVDWGKTRAYALALGQIYVNLKGREREGVVAPGAEYEALRDELKLRFGALRDPETGEIVVRRVYKREELYRGPYFDEAPDLVVGFERGYRVSWQTSLGGIPPELIEPNLRRWSADHCSVDPDLVPGVLFSSRPLHATSPSIVDIAPSVLIRLGVTPPASMDGRDLGLR